MKRPDITRIAALLALVLLPSLLQTSDASGAGYKSWKFQASKRHPRVIFAPRKTPTGTIRIQFRAGAFEDGFKKGLTRLTQQAMLGANSFEKYETFIVDLYAANGTLSIETGVRQSAFVLTAPKQDFQKLAERLARMCLSPDPRFTGFEASKSRTLQDQANAGVNDLTAMFARTVFSESGFGNTPYGDKDGIRSLNLDDVKAHLKKHMTPANATVIVAGAFNNKRMKSFLARFRGGTRRARERPFGEHAGTYHLRSWVEFHFVAYPIDLSSQRSVAAAHLAGAIMQERLFNKFRQMGIAYSVQAMPMHREWLDFLMVVLPIHSERQMPVAAHLQKQVDAIRLGNLLENELERNRAYLLRIFEKTDRDSVLLAKELGMGAGEVEWFSPKVVKEVSKMTKEQFVQSVSPWLGEKTSIHVEFSPRTTAAAMRGRSGK